MSQPLEKPAPSQNTDQASRAEASIIRARLLQMIVQSEQARKSKSQ
ncbi:MAG: hypothetical protein ACYC6N_28370 [Pirellulaceae bacterium]